MNPRFVPTKTHSVLDYLSVGILVLAPRALRWGPRATRVVTSAAAGTLAYSLLTRYELGLKKLLPMPAHLALDATSGALLCASPAFLPEEDGAVAVALVGLGAFEIAAALLTKTRPPARVG